ncbi:MAG: two-component regulator propeller domain-containing protein, partial [Chitinophagaceae bacterium]
MLQGVLQAQPAALMPEADFGKGLPSNNVLAAQVDNAGSVWVGTDKGLVILGDAKNKFENIRNTTGIQEIWSLAFYKTYVLIASRYNGLYIFDTKTAKLVQHVNKEDVGLCR